MRVRIVRFSSVSLGRWRLEGRVEAHKSEPRGHTYSYIHFHSCWNNIRRRDGDRKLVPA